jgi:dipeptidyl aminopeptidase/acylaminoacyl peptidase
MRRISDSPGYDSGCRYSPDGRYLAFRTQLRAGYEGDRWRLVVYDRASGVKRTLTDAFDRQVDPMVFSADSKTIFFTAEDRGSSPVFSMPVAGGPVATVLPGPGTFSDLGVLPDGRTLVASLTTLTHTAEVVRFGVDGKGLARVTRVNDELLKTFALRAGESVSYTGAAGKSVQAWVVRPPDFDAAKKYPLLVLVHGGPQGSWPDGWSYRWNAQVFASAGYLVFMPNPRGSTGWGQEFTDDINHDWGGRAFEDVMKGTDFALTLPGVDTTRAAAAGASYGGYMIDWIAGQTDRFKALVTHDGVFDLVSMYGSTEELWFPEWEFGGPYWSHPEGYLRYNPRDFVKNFKTPTLVIHGEKDYRVPLEQSLAMFTALRRQDVPARLLLFPDENHWVLQPQNSVRWYAEVVAWLDRWTKP